MTAAAGAPPARTPLLARGTVGAFAVECALLSAAALALFQLPASVAAARAVAEPVAAAVLLVALFFPPLAAASPAPANGPKLVVFPAALMLALARWLPATWIAQTETLQRVLLGIAVVGNVAVLLVPRVRAKQIEWRSGGWHFRIVAALGLALAITAVILRPLTIAVIPVRIAAIELAFVFGFFVWTRTIDASRVHVGRLVWLSLLTGCFLLAVLSSMSLTAVSAHEGATGLALAFGALYALTHAAAAGTVVWSALSAALAWGAVGYARDFAWAFAAAAIVAVVVGIWRRTARGAVAAALIAAITLASRAFEHAALAAGTESRRADGMFAFVRVIAFVGAAYSLFLFFPSRATPNRIVLFAFVIAAAAWAIHGNDGLLLATSVGVAMLISIERTSPVVAPARGVPA